VVDSRLVIGGDHRLDDFHRQQGGSPILFDMSVKRVTTQSLPSRLGKSLSGILGGIALFILSVVLLWWNEERAVDTAMDLAEGESAVIPLEQIHRIDPATKGALIHLTGMAESSDTLRDGAFGIEIPALKLRRTVEMLQWRELTESKTRTKLGGGTETETTFSYEKIWADTLIDSSRFEVTEGHRNPTVKPLESLDIEADEIHLGAYRLGPGLVAKLGKFEELPPPESLPEGHVAQGNVIFRSADPNAPQIGDLRITLKAAMPAEISVIARNNNGLLDGYRANKGSAIQLLQYGNVDANGMFQSAKSANKALTFGLRILGIILMFIGANSVMGPIGVLADVIPPLGRITRVGTSLISAIITLPVALVTIALAWLSHRPVLAVGLMILGGALAFAILYFARKRKVAAA
jgi:hypothetical protein